MLYTQGGEGLCSKGEGQCFFNHSGRILKTGLTREERFRKGCGYSQN